MTQPINSGAPIPVQGVTGGPGLPVGAASIDGTTGNIVLTPPSNTIQQKKTDSPQAFQIYEFFHSDSDFVRISLATATGGPEFIGVEVFPAGVLRDLVVGTSGSLFLSAGAATRWSIIGTSGELSPTGNGLLDIGDFAHLVRNVFVAAAYIQTQGAGSFHYGGTGVPLAGLGANGDFYFRVDGAALTTIYQKRGGAWVGIV